MAPIQLSQADDGRSLAVAAGQQVVLRLPENPTTGYRWEPAPGIELVADEFRTADAGAMGAGGERVFTLAAPRVPLAVCFELKRPWGSGAPERSVTIHFTQSA